MTTELSKTAKILPESGKSYRLITRSDMDGLVCGVLLKKLKLIDDIAFAHPKDMQDGLIEVDQNDISTNLPYVGGIYLAFDHHDSEIERVSTKHDNHIIDSAAPSAARVVYDYFGGADVFPASYNDMMKAVDKADAAALSQSDILEPKGWELVSFLMDARTSLGRFRDFSISNYQLMMKLIDLGLEEISIEEILKVPDVKERVDLFFEHEEKCKEQIKNCTTIHKNLAVLDLRNEDTIWAGNRFLIYALFPQTNISMHVLWGKAKQNTVFAVGKSILDRSSKTHVGSLMLKYGGGGHQAAGTCQIPTEKAEDTQKELISAITNDG